MARPGRKLLVIVAGVSVLLGLAYVVTTVTMSTPFLSEPNPNGYQDFVTAAGMVPEAVGDFRDFDQPALRALVTTNADALKLVREGFTKECALPVRTAIQNWAISSRNLMQLKRLAQLLAAEGRLAELENRPADAALSYTDAIRLGNEISKHGYLIQRLVGIAVESIGAMPLGRLIPELDAKQAAPVVVELRKIDQSRVTWEEIRLSERMFMRHELPKVSPLSWPQGIWQNWQVMRSAKPRHTTAVARVRLLALQLSSRCYFLENGQPPPSLQALVPKYLDAKPVDPFTDRPFVYRIQGTNWLLYSVGSDGIDDGGKPVSRGGGSKGDVFFDTM